ncbi:hypothetical protein HNR40_005299 [Nonomuraea endophytica]|uniref:Uncharacterized protein n=1 Tax=Nonomuraea endophytica TaxID=714136 RepID=A0A7W8A5C3_9ACTN|nr:hypothetical protein [Nonomuraea endophytica]
MSTIRSLQLHLETPLSQPPNPSGHGGRAKAERWPGKSGTVAGQERNGGRARAELLRRATPLALTTSARQAATHDGGAGGAACRNGEGAAQAGRERRTSGAQRGRNTGGATQRGRSTKARATRARVAPQRERRAEAGTNTNRTPAQPDCRTARSWRTAREQRAEPAEPAELDGRTAGQPDSRTAEQPDSRTARRLAEREGAPQRVTGQRKWHATTGAAQRAQRNGRGAASVVLRGGKLKEQKRTEAKEGGGD